MGQNGFEQIRGVDDKRLWYKVKGNTDSVYISLDEVV